MPGVMLFVGTEPGTAEGYDAHLVRESLLGLLRILSQQSTVQVAFHEAAVALSVSASREISSQLKVWIGPHIGEERINDGVQAVLSKASVIRSSFEELIAGENAPQVAIFMGCDQAFEEQARKFTEAGTECFALPATGETARILNAGICAVTQQDPLRELLDDPHLRGTRFARALLANRSL